MTYPKDPRNSPNLGSPSVLSQADSESIRRSAFGEAGLPMLSKALNSPDGEDHECGNAYAPDGKLMIRSFTLSNFRCFKHETVSDCRRINILVGRNSSGKTSFLEGVLLAMSNSAEPVARLRQWRGLDTSMFQGAQNLVADALWGSLFRDSSKEYLELKMKGDDGHTRNLKIVRSFEIGESFPGMYPTGVKFTWNVKGEKDFDCIPVMINGNVQVQPGPPTASEVFFFASNHAYSSIESATRLSELSKALKLRSFTEVFQQRYPDVEDLTVELVAGVPLIHAKLKDLNRRVPLSYVSGGMNKFASMLLAFVFSPKSIVLIDEIENGLYFRDMPAIWQLLLDFARQFDCQLFASTHSGECLEAASEIAAENQGEFSIIQANKGELHQFPGDKFVWAAEANVEIR